MSTQTDHFKFDPSHCIIEPSVDPSEWRKECDKVCNLLVIPENVEFIYNSQSEENVKSFLNFEDINVDYYNRGRSLSVLSQYFNKMTSHQDLTKCLTFANSLENQVGLLDKYENSLTKILEKKLGGLNKNSFLKRVIHSDFERI